MFSRVRGFATASVNGAAGLRQELRVYDDDIMDIAVLSVDKKGGLLAERAANAAIKLDRIVSGKRGAP